MTRVLLDTNVWGQLVDAGAIQDLRKRAKAEGLQILVAPAVVYELLRTRQPDRQRDLVKAVTLGSWSRLMTEVFEECQDLLAVCEERRPAWMRPDPDLTMFHELRADWAGGRGFWHRARTNPAREATVLTDLEDDLLDKARDEARDRRQSMKDFHFDSIELEGWLAKPQYEMPGWRGDAVDVWRLQTATYWWDVLMVQAAEPHLDWLGPFLDLRAIRENRAAWNELWLYEVPAADVPREWLRWAVMLLQSVRKTTAGTPGDNQISLYALEADVAISGDAGFVAILNKAAPYAPAPVAAGRHLKVGPDPAASIVALSNLSDEAAET